MQRLQEMRVRYRSLVAEYGMVAVTFHLSVFALVGVGGACVFGFGGQAHAVSTLGAIGAGYALTQMTSPLRFGLTFAVTPFLASVLSDIRAD